MKTLSNPANKNFTVMELITHMRSNGDYPSEEEVNKVNNLPIQTNCILDRKCPNQHSLQCCNARECMMCTQILPGSGCLPCKFHICYKCDSNVQNINNSKLCYIGDSIVWVGEKIKCNKCNSINPNGFKCPKCEYYQLCLCCYKDFKFPLSVCPNNHEIKWDSNKSDCSRCSFSLAGYVCLTCRYKICSRCKNNSNNSIQINPLLIAGACLDHSIKIWDVSGGHCIRTLTGHSDIITCLVKMNDNEIISSSKDKTIKIWEISSGNCIRTLFGLDNMVYSLGKVNEHEIAGGYFDSTIKIWNVSNGNCVKTLTGLNNLVYSILKLNENEIAGGCCDNSIKIWNILKGNCVKTLIGHTSYVNSIIKLNENEIASGSYDHSIKIWNISTENCIRTLTGHTYTISSLVKINETDIASASADNSIKIWDVNAGICIRTITGHIGDVNSIVKLSETVLASASGDKTIKIWDLSNGNCIKTFVGGSNGLIVS